MQQTKVLHEEYTIEEAQPTHRTKSKKSRRRRKITATEDLLYLPSNPIQGIESRERTVLQTEEDCNLLPDITNKGDDQLTYRTTKPPRASKQRRFNKVVDEAQDLVQALNQVKGKDKRKKNWKFAYEMYCREIIAAAGLMQ